MKYQVSKNIGLAGLAIMALVCGNATAADEPKVLNVYNWADYLPDGLLANFEKETGIKVRYDTFDTNEIVHAKLIAGRTGYDIIVPSANWAALHIQAGLLRKLNKAQLPNLKNSDVTMTRLLAKVDPGNQYLVNWAWGFITLGINVDKVKSALGATPMPTNAWSLFFDPQYSNKLKSCGISMLDSATDIFPAALHYMGKPAYSSNPADYADAAKMMRVIRPNIKIFSSGINDLAGGGLCMAVGYSGDMNIAAKRAREGKTGQKIEALVPSTGGLLFYDNMAIPLDAEHPNNAHIFINYILRPEVAASISNKMNYATMNAASEQFVDKDIRENKSIFLTPEAKKTMVPSGTTTNDMRRIMTRAFTTFKTGL
ncbi:MAG: extracellular solute-binding protein [Burkholderiales bacterium]